MSKEKASFAIKGHGNVMLDSGKKIDLNVGSFYNTVEVTQDEAEVGIGLHMVRMNWNKRYSSRGYVSLDKLSPDELKRILPESILIEINETGKAVGFLVYRPSLV